MNRRGLVDKYGPVLSSRVEEAQSHSRSATEMEKGGAVVDRVRSLVHECVGGFSVVCNDDNASLQQLGCDSLSAARLGTRLRDLFALPPETSSIFGVSFLLSDLGTVMKISERVEACLQECRNGVIDLAKVKSVVEDRNGEPGRVGKSEEEAIQEMRHDMKLSSWFSLDELQVESHSHVDAAQDIKSVLLTGATGFLGLHLLAHMLLHTQWTVYCIVRGKSESQAKRKLLESLRDAIGEPGGGRVDTRNLQSRVTCLKGDIGVDYFGITQSKYKNLCTTIDLVLHCAAQVNHVLSYAALRTANVVGTINILRLLLEGRRAKRKMGIVHISTVGVITKDMILQSEGEAVVLEAPLGDDPSLLRRHNGYGQSKWVSEKLVDELWQHGHISSCSIYRPAFIAGHSSSGHCNPSDTVTRLMCSMCELNAFPVSEESDSELVLDMSPVDYVSLGIIASASQVRASQLIMERSTSAQSRSSAPVFHTIHPHHLVSVEDIASACKEQGYRVEGMREKIWRNRVLDNENSFRPLAGSSPNHQIASHMYPLLVLNTFKLFSSSYFI